MYRNAADLLTLYPVPDELQSEEQADVFANRDLPGETDHSLRRELTVLRFMNFFTDSDWHEVREEAIANEISYRRSRRRLEHSSRNVERVS